MPRRAILPVGGLLVLAWALSGCGPENRPAVAEPEGPRAVKVELRREQSGWVLTRAGRPYFIRGAGGGEPLDVLRRLGANSVRTWGVGRNTRQLLDSAQRNGMTVALGIWLGHRKHGFDYNNPRHVREQFEKARKAVLAYRDHPALLLWGIGNEMEAGGNDKPEVWRAVEEIAAMIQRLDPNHPTMVVTAEIGDAGERRLRQYCPSIDIWGINAYRSAPTLPQRLDKRGYRGPYILTEFGPDGPWEVPKTPWGTPIEPSSAAKTRMYAQAYRGGVLADPKRCLGSYAFFWAAKREGSDTWFGLLTSDGTRLAPVDALIRNWTGAAPKSPAAECAFRRPDPAGVTVRPGARIPVEVTLTDPRGGAMEVWLEWRQDGRGNPNERPAVTGERIRRWKALRVSPLKTIVSAPAKPGGYRLYAWVRNGSGKLAYHNVSVLVQGKQGG